MKPVISAEEALRHMEEKYANLYRNDLRSVTVQELTLEYVPVATDPSAEKGYTVYPAWVARISIEYEEYDNPYMFYEAYDAVTGKPLF